MIRIELTHDRFEEDLKAFGIAESVIMVAKAGLSFIPVERAITQIYIEWKFFEHYQSPIS